MTPDRWLVLTVRVPSPGPDDLVADALVGLGGRAVEERDGAYVTHFPPPDDPDGFLAEARRRLEALPGVDAAELHVRWQPHEAWTEIWKEGLAPRRITERVVVTPTWVEPEVGPDDVVIRLDPGMAFGTAEHATTRGCLRLVDGCVGEGERVADLGAGTAILSIAAARLGAREVVAVESDPLACEPARANAAANDVADRIRVMERRIDAPGVAELAPLDGIVANIEAGVLLRLAPGFAPALTADGWLVLGGVVHGEEDRVLRAVRAHGFELDAEDAEEGWWSGRFRLAGGG